MTTIATSGNTSTREAPRAAPAQSQPAAHGPCTLSEAVQAVNDHQRQVEMRRMALAARRRTPSDDWPVPVPRSHLQTLEQQAREAAALRGLLDNGPLIAVPFSAAPPYTLRDMPASLCRAMGHRPDGGGRELPLTRLFSAADLPRLQQALFDGDAATLTVHLRRADGRAWRCNVHLSAKDAADPDWRWVCIVPDVAPPAEEAVQPVHDRRLAAKSSPRPRLDAWPAA
jgi:hypothetical protein